MRDSLVPVCDIMGVRIAAVDMPYVVAYIEERVEHLRGNYICVSNVHTTVMSYEDKGYRKIQNESAISIPDGAPLSAVGRRRGFEEMRRTAGPDLMRVLFERAEINGLSHCFYGSTPETLASLDDALKLQCPALNVVGLFSPPFGEIDDEEDERHVHLLNESGADIVWVGLGAPKQERWMAAHEGRVNALMIGVGAGFDYFAGSIQRAPRWMQDLSLEWLYRLVQDPKRLVSRYAKTNGKFLWQTAVLGR